MDNSLSSLFLSDALAIEKLLDRALSIKGIEKEKKELHQAIEDFQAPLQVMVMGSFSTGKSSFINALLGEDVTAVGALPTTAIITKLSHGENKEVVVHYLDETEKTYPVADFLGMVDENSQAWKDLREKISYVDRFLPLDILKEINIIDSPGLEAIKEAHTKITKSFVNRADVIFWMFSAENVGTATEMKNLENLEGRFQPVAIINKMDTLDEEEDDPGEFLHGARLKLQGKVAEVLGISAEYGLQGKKEHSDELLEESNIAAVERYIQREIVPQSAMLKINSFLEKVGSAYGAVRSDFDDYLKVMKNTASDKDVKAAQTYVKEACAYLERYFARFVNFSLRESEKGNSSADLLLAFAYFFGYQNHPEGFEDSIAYFKRAAEANDTSAQIFVAMYQMISGHVSEGEIWLDKAEENYVEGVDDIETKQLLYETRGILSELKKNPNEAVTFYTTAMEAGSASAANRLGRLLDEGENVRHDYRKAAECYRFAAEHDEPYAQYNLGKLYYEGRGVEKNEAEALRWIRSAAEQDIPNAQISLGSFYASGDCGVRQDAKESVFWLQRASEQGSLEAKNTLLSIYGGGAKGIQPDYPKFMELAEECYSQGLEIDPDFLCVAGDMYVEGKNHVRKDVYRGAQMFEVAAKKGSAIGQYRLGILYMLGDGVPQDFDEAYWWAKKSADQGYEGAIDDLPYLKQMKENPSEARRRIAENRSGESSASTDNEGCLVWLACPAAVLGLLYHFLA